MPNITTKPLAMAIKEMMTWTVVKAAIERPRIMTILRLLAASRLTYTRDGAVTMTNAS
jgi:hypothetical protein